MTLRRAILKHLLIFASLFSMLVTVQAITPLPADQVFQLKTEQTATGVRAIWQIKAGYHLYKDRIQVRLHPRQAGTLGTWAWPPAIMKDDAAFGRTAVYHTRLLLEIPVTVKTPGPAELSFSYQGCADTFCYPPVVKTIPITLQALHASSAPATTETTPSPQGHAARVLAGHRWWVIILSFLGFGLLLSLTPCVLPMVPILSGIIVGHGHRITHGKAFRLSLTYVFCVALAYSAAGMLVALAGSRLTAAMQAPPVIIAFGLLFIVLAFSLFGFYELRLPHTWQDKLHTWTGSLKGGHYLSVAIMGVLSALIVSPCVTAPLVGALIYISQTGDVLLGGLALFCLGLGMGAPLLLVGVGSRSLLPKTGKWMKGVQILLGVMLIGVAVSMFARVVPFTHLLPSTASQQSEIPFIKVKSYSDVRQAIQNSKKPVLLDFYADWCVACKKMEHDVYTKPDVRELLQQFTLLKADITANDDVDKALLNHLDVIAPPTWLFFTLKGQELRAQRLVGERSVSAFAQHLRNVLSTS